MSLTQQLSRLLPLPENELQQILDYASTLPKQAAAEHLSNLLGTEPQAVAFISSFNSKRKDAPGPPAPSGGATTSGDGRGGGLEHVPKPKKGKGKGKVKAPLHVPEARRVENPGYLGTAYNKHQADLEYIPRSSKSSPAPESSAAQHAPPQKTATPEPPKEILAPKPAAPPKRAQAQQSGFLISDPAPKTKPKSNNSSRSSTPKPSNSTKISIAGGTPMKGASTALTDLESAIRSLELSSNPKATGDPASRRCNCIATRHPLQTAAPNCLSCGKVICVKEGLGPCTSCGSPILTDAETEAILRELRAERSREKQAIHRAAHRKHDVSRTPAPFTAVRDGGFEGGSLAEAEAKAREHRDRLLAFQAQNAQRTTVRDEVADFDVGAAMGGPLSMWSTPEERALELKRQQKVLREMEWDAKPEWEKRTQVLSIDLVGGKIVRRMAAVQRPPTPEEETGVGEEELSSAGGYGGVLGETDGNVRGKAGAFSKNPLLGELIRPVYSSKGKEREKGSGTGVKWRRVQDDMDDNEGVILDGGVYGYEEGGSTMDGADEPALSYAEVAAKNSEQTAEEAAAPALPELNQTTSQSVHAMASTPSPPPSRSSSSPSPGKKKKARHAGGASGAASGVDCAALAHASVIVAVGAVLGLKAWGLYERGALGWREVGLGAGILGAVGAAEVVVSRLWQERCGKGGR
ncbi:related to C2HC5 finger protein [Cephalotrichum gorgonifer]|uniref:Related to C2HC5 finger protein n=1 Tax=Cephalotrichum gorgonifer TaxID=2041049 RepID=A0AAE8MXN3_9PEZI|nr:related to C2HC5 finger protein [Cephalotrichum gorgonifer]